MKVSGKEVANTILEDLKQKIAHENLKPNLAIIFASLDVASEIYVNNKVKAAAEIGVEANIYRFDQNQQAQCIQEIEQLSNDEQTSGIIIQYPVFPTWNFEELLGKVDLKKDVDGFLPNSPFLGATALGVWAMLREFAHLEGYKMAEEFLKQKNVVLIGKGRAAGKPTMRLFERKGIKYTLIDSKTENPDEIIKNADVVISATGRKNIVNGENIKTGSYIIGVGVGREEIAGENKQSLRPNGLKTYGDINEAEIAEQAKLYCPTIGGIGPLTIACLLKNVVSAAQK